MYYPTVQDVELVIEKLNRRYDMNVTIINRGQLEFALEKPKMEIFGHEHYKELYQKSAVLMEVLTKSHALSDGNKRCAMMVAEFMIRVNDAELVLPLKAIRLSVDTAMDEHDVLTEEIEQWFKVHIAKNSDQLAIMLEEHIEEESIINSLLSQEKYEEAYELVDKWLAFDSYPEHKVKWKQLVDRWKKNKPIQNASKIREMTIWDMVGGLSQYEAQHPAHSYKTITKTEDLRVVGHTLEELKRYEKTIQAHEKALARMDNLPLLYHKGYILEQCGRIDKSLSVYDKIISARPSEGHAYCHRGMLYGEFFKEYKKAIENFRKCIELGEQNQVASDYIAHGLFRLNEYEQAIKQCDKNIQCNEKNSTSYRIKGACLAEKGCLDDAEKTVREALALDPTNHLNSSYLGVILSKKGNYAEAIKHHKHAVSVEPKSIVFRLNLTNAYVQTNQIDKAEENYKVVLGIDENHVEALNNYGALLSNKGEYSKALTYLNKALDIEPTHEAALLNTGITYTKIDDYENAMKFVDKAIRLYPKGMHALYNKATILMKQNKIDDALVWVEKTVRADSDAKKIFLNDRVFERIKNSESFKKLTE